MPCSAIPRRGMRTTSSLSSRWPSADGGAPAASSNRRAGMPSRRPCRRPCRLPKRRRRRRRQRRRQRRRGPHTSKPPHGRLHAPHRRRPSRRRIPSDPSSHRRCLPGPTAARLAETRQAVVAAVEAVEAVVEPEAVRSSARSGTAWTRLSRPARPRRTPRRWPRSRTRRPRSRQRCGRWSNPVKVAPCV